MTTQGPQQMNKPLPDTYVRPPQDCRFGQFVRAALLAIGISLPVLIVGGALMYADFAEVDARHQQQLTRAAALDNLRSAPPLEILPASDIMEGHKVFARACAACHSPSGRGVPGVGPDLVDSWFVALADDERLRTLIKEGRQADDPDNTLGIPMPPMGGHELTEDEVNQVVVYLRMMQDPRRKPELPEGALDPPAPEPPAEGEEWFLAAADGDEELAMYIAHGAQLYANSCAACHGRDGRGVQGTGTSLINSEFIEKLDDEELIAFIKRGRDPGAPDNVTGVGMPARGGNPALDDDDLWDIVDYLRALNRMSEAE